MRKKEENVGRYQKGILMGLAAAVSILLIACLPYFAFLRSLAVMSIYSHIHEKQSIMEEQGIDLHIPGGLTTREADWYPFVMTFQADEAYRSYTGEKDARLTILYNFPAFSLSKGCSRLYDTESPYYNGFYGAYLVKDSNNAGQAQGSLDEKLAASIARFDFFWLVLGDFGLPEEKQVFDFKVTDRQENVTFAGHEGFTKMAADVLVNGSAHNKRKGVMSYLQYGSPGFGDITEEEEFAPVRLSGLIYGKYFDEWDTGIYFYAMGSEKAIDCCENHIFPEIRLGDKEQMAGP